MGRQAKGALERPVEAKAINLAGLGQLDQANVLGEVRVQVLASDPRHLGQAWVGVDAFAPQGMAGHAAEQLVHCCLPEHFQITAMHRLEGPGNGPGQLRVGAQGVGKTGLATRWRVLEQCLQLALQPLRIEVEHRISEAVLGRCMTVVDFPRFQHEHLARGAEVLQLAAMKLLHALFGDTDQVTVVPVRVIGVALEMRAHRLDTGVGVLGEIDPVVAGHGGLRAVRRGHARP
uniref:Uncharacterized protein n=1 Tax=Pseudomonas fluorescens TaxID=294 RepID=A0A5E6TUG5_PSEFL|nr:hypothetical protein PS652_03038 [Pseudomonas fluorescens]